MRSIQRHRVPLGLFTTASFTIVSAFAGTAAAQCYDFAEGFDAAGLGTQGSIYCMLRVGAGEQERLIVGGSFTEIGGVAAQGVAVWDGVRWTALGTGVQATFALTMFDDGSGARLFAAGDFTTQTGGAGDRIAAWNGTNWEPLASGGLDGRVLALTTHDDGTGAKLYAAGAFLSANGLASPSLAAWDGDTWSSVGNNTPLGLQFHRAARDRFGDVLVFGGNNLFQGNLSNMTWTFDGTRWSRRFPAFSPSARAGHIAAYDPVRERAFVYGGVESDTTTYAWDGANWSALVTQGNPGALIASTAAFDPPSGKTILFGGRRTQNGSNPPTGQTWAFDGSAWTLLSASGPAARSGATMAFDPIRSHLVLFGGYSPSLGLFNDTWIWQGGQWTQAQGAGGPATGTNAAEMCFDPTLGRIVMFDNVSGGLGWTWSWNGASWDREGAARTPTTGGCIMYTSPATGSLYRHGGDGSETFEFVSGEWVFRSLAPRTITSIASYNSSLYVGGGFSTFTPGVNSCAARFGPDRVWRPLPVTFTSGGIVNRIIPLREKLAFLGNFHLSGSLQHFVVTDGATFESPTTIAPPDQGYQAAKFANFGFGDVLLVATQFGMRYWNGSAWISLDSTPGNSAITAIEPFGSGLAQRAFVGGSFSSVMGKPANGIVPFGDLCTAPIFTRHPDSTVAFLTQGCIIQASVIGTRPIALQWFKDGVPLSNVSGRISGVNDERLYLANFTEQDYGAYTLRATNVHGVTLSNPAYLTPWSFAGGVIDPYVISATGRRVNGQIRTPTRLSPPLVHPDASVIYHEVATGSSVYVREHEGVYTDIVAAGGPAPGMPSGSVLNLTSLARGDSLNSSLIATGSQGGTHIAGLYRLGPQRFDLIAKVGDALPGLSPTQILGSLDAAPLISPSGSLVFSGNFRERNSPTFLGRAVWRWSDSDGIQFVTAQGRIAPGTTNLPFTVLPDVPAIGPSGSAIVRGALATRTGFGRGNSADDGLWRQSSGPLTMLAARPARSPNMPANSNIDDVFNYRELADGSVLFSAYVCSATSSSTTGVFRVRDGVLSDIALPGQSLPDFDGTPAGVIASVDWLNTNARGDIILLASLVDAPGGMWVLEANRVRRISKSGATAPAFLPPFATLGAVTNAGIDESGRVVYQTTGRFKIPDVPPVEFTAVMGADPLTGQFPIVLPSTKVQIAPNVQLTATGAEIARTAINPAGRFDTASPIAGDGTVSLLARFGGDAGAVIRIDFDAVRNATACPFDANADGFLDYFDFIAFIDCFEGTACLPATDIRPPQSADLNQDQFVDFFDLIDFIDGFESGC
ncbi:MAG: immunoglobulin domain-containing protein [Tepidisphaera sp.]